MKYTTVDGEETTLYRLVRDEPDWAMSRIKESERLAKLASQRGARMQIMREWMMANDPTDWLLMAQWFDSDGVPFNE